MINLTLSALAERQDGFCNGYEWVLDILSQSEKLANIVRTTKQIGGNFEKLMQRVILLTDQLSI